MSPRPKKDAPPVEPGTDGDANGKTGDPPEDAAGLQEELAQRDATIAELQEQLAQREATIAELQEQLAQRDTTIAELEQTAAAAGENTAAPPASGEKRKVTYLGRPEMLAKDDNGEPTETDVYNGADPWSDTGGVTLAVGESAYVSAEKAAQLAADHPDAFEID